MPASERHIDITVSARYYTHGNLNPKTKYIWYALHGYGQLVKYFIRKFEDLDPDEHYVVAPEGLNRFYLNGFDGRVGATWMTRENRLVDIANYLTYLDNLHKVVLQNMPKAAKVNILGFSQGAATASRWATNGSVSFENLILWAGIFPPDLEIQDAHKKLKNKSSFIIIGDKDEYITPQRMDEMNSIVKDLDIKPKVIEYSGGHSIDPKMLQDLSNSYL